MLRGLGPPADVTIIPGNHDAYVAVRGPRGPLSRLSPYMASDAPQRAECLSHDLSCPFPTLRVRKHVALIGLSTARPCLPFLAIGRLGIPQIERLDQLLEEAGRSALFRVVLIHHPPGSGRISWRKRLMDLDALGSVLTLRGAELVLHGHTHRGAYSLLKGPSGAIPVIGVPSSTTFGRTQEKRARYHLYSIPEGPDGAPFRVHVRAYSPAFGGSFVEEPFSCPGQPVIKRS